MKKKQKRSSLLTVTIILLILIGLGVGGRILLRQYDKVTSTTDASTGAPINASTQFLTISQWGIKFALTAETADAYYDTSTTSSVDSMSLRVHSLDTEASCKNDPLSVAGIYRVTPDAMDEFAPGKKYIETKEGKVVGDYFYYIESAQIQCARTANARTLLQGVLKGFNSAGPSIQKA